MNIDIRNHVISNFKNVDKEEIKETIEESLKEEDDLVLPGFGVFFELLWKNSSLEQQENILFIIEKAINQK
jgi:small acid-soluble spore protein I (minor)